MKQVFLASFFLFIFTALSFAANELLAAGGVSFQAPELWQASEPSSPLRLYQFKIPGKDETLDGELAVYYFGANQGGGVEENIQRWIAQYSVLSPDFPPEQNKQTVGSLPVTTVHVEGTLQGGMPGMPTEAKSDYATLAAAIEGPQGSVFFKMMGPKETIRNAKADFTAMVAGLKA